MGIGLGGCASLTPISGPLPPPSRPEVVVDIAEIRPGAVVLEVRGVAATHIELWRDAGGGAQLLEATDLDPAQSEALAAGATLIDQAPVPGSLVYTVVLQQHAGPTQQARTSVVWAPAPPPPDVTVAFLPDVGVHLKWDGPSGCLVLRRDVIANGRWEVAQRSATCHGEFVDTTATAGAVYAYRVATSAWPDGYPRYSQPSPEVYVTAQAMEPD